MVMTGFRAAAALAFLSAPSPSPPRRTPASWSIKSPPRSPRLRAAATGLPTVKAASTGRKWRHRGSLSAMGFVRRRQAGGREEPAGQGGQRAEAGQRFDHDRRRGRQGERTTISISSYDIDEDKDISLLVKATNPGNCTMAKAPPEGEEEGAGGPKDGSAGKAEAPGIED